MGNIGATELLVIALIAVLLFGAGRIADIGKGLGQGIKNFKQGLKDEESEDEVLERKPKKLASKSSDAKSSDAKSSDKSVKKKVRVSDDESSDDEDEEDDDARPVREEKKAKEA